VSAHDPAPPTWALHVEPEDAPGTPRRRRLWVVTAVTAVVLLAVAGAGVVTALVVENSTARTLIDRVEASEAVMIRFQESVEAEVEKDGPAADVTGPASEARDALVRARADVAAVAVPRWSTSQRDARRAYLDHVDEWIISATALSEPGGTSTNGSEIDRTFTAACYALRAAVPRVAGDDDARRVDTICEQGGEGAGSGPPGLAV
jgi:hypothetical protein